MTDEEVKPVEPQEPAQAEPEPAQEPEATQEEPTFVTREELDRLLAQTKREVKQADKQRAKQIKAEMDTMKQRLEAAGVPLTPEVEQKLHAQIVDNLRDDDEEQPTGNSTPDIPPELEDAFAMMKEEKVSVQEGDPEYKEFLEPLFDNDNSSRWQYTAAMRKAIDAKKARTLQQQEKAPLRTPVPGGQGPGENAAKDAREYYQKAYS
jgi:hypothetical protein